VRIRPVASSASWRSIFANEARISRYSSAEGLQAIASSTELASAGFEAACSPGPRSASRPGWFTATDPSTTETTEPPRPADTAKTVPFTEAIESRVITRRCPRRCFAARTITSPRWRWMAWPLQAAVTYISVRSLTSSVDPSASRKTAWAPGPVRISSFSPMAAPGARAPAGRR